MTSEAISSFNNKRDIPQYDVKIRIDLNGAPLKGPVNKNEKVQFGDILYAMNKFKAERYDLDENNCVTMPLRVFELVGVLDGLTDEQREAFGISNTGPDYTIPSPAALGEDAVNQFGNKDERTPVHADNPENSGTITVEATRNKRGTFNREPDETPGPKNPLEKGY